MGDFTLFVPGDFFAFLGSAKGCTLVDASRVPTVLGLARMMSSAHLMAHISDISGGNDDSHGVHVRIVRDDILDLRFLGIDFWFWSRLNDVLGWQWWRSIYLSVATAGGFSLFFTLRLARVD